jgi:hypothetical protein
MPLLESIVATLGPRAFQRQWIRHGVVRKFVGGLGGVFAWLGC